MESIECNVEIKEEPELNASDYFFETEPFCNESSFTGYEENDIKQEVNDIINKENLGISDEVYESISSSSLEQVLPGVSTEGLSKIVNEAQHRSFFNDTEEFKEDEIDIISIESSFLPRVLLHKLDLKKGWDEVSRVHLSKHEGSQGTKENKTRRKMARKSSQAIAYSDSSIEEPFESGVRKSTRINTARLHSKRIYYYEDSDEVFSNYVGKKSRTNRRLSSHIRKKDNLDNDSSDGYIYSGDDEWIENEGNEMDKVKSIKKSRIKETNNNETPLKVFKCFVCGHSFKTKPKFEVHLRKHTGEKPYSCTYCSYTASQLSIVKDHERIHTGEKPYQCPFCPYKASQRSTLNRHKKTHSYGTQKSIKCPFCSVGFTRKFSLRHHLRMNHADEDIDSIISNSFTQCGCVAYTTATTEAVNSRGSLTKEEVYRCSKCEFSTTEWSKFSYHNRVLANSTNANARFVCDICSYSTTSKFIFEGHNRTHSGIKPYKCKFCSYRARQMSTLRGHLLTHSGDRPFKCELCSFNSTKNKLLENHYLKCHENDDDV